MRYFILIPAICILTASLALAQWEPDVRLTNDSAGSCLPTSSGWGVGASGSMVHVVWEESRDDNWEIYYRRSTDRGVNWGPDTRLTSDSAMSYLPTVAVNGSAVHVAWRDSRDRGIEVYYKRSTDDGATWSADTRLTDSARVFQGVSAAVSGSMVHVAWDDLRSGDAEIHYVRSTDGGATWGEDVRLTNDSYFSYNPSVAASGSVVLVVWEDRRAGYDVYCRRSTDGGASWGADTRLSDDSTSSFQPSVAMTGSLVHVAWHGYILVGYKRSTDGGATWGPDIRLTEGGHVDNHLSAAVSGNTAHVVWQDTRGGDRDLYYLRSTDNGATWSAETSLTNDTCDNFAPSVAAGGDGVHVVWRDDRDGVHEIYYKRDPTGAVVGTEEAMKGEGASVNRGPTIVRGVLVLPRDMTCLGHDPDSPGGIGSCPALLQDAFGRKVMDLLPGPNDVRHLAPGVYFVRAVSGEPLAVGCERPALSRVVVIR